MTLPKYLGVALVGSLLATHQTMAWAQSAYVMGESVFKSRCVICHGIHADGRSALARIMRPPPANLRASVLSDADQAQIVRKGGESVGRSPNMPVWEMELNEAELQAVLSYVASLRERQP